MYLVTKINSFVFMDLESTGIPRLEPFGQKSRITEMSFVSVQRNAFLKTVGDLPRPLNKLSFVINPEKPISDLVTRMTGLSTEMLQNERPFDNRRATMLTIFLETLTPPVCLIAHNGKLFDFPLLQSELMLFDTVFPSSILCADSLAAFRALIKNPTTENEPIFCPFITSTDLECVDVVDQIEKQLAYQDELMNRMDLIKQLNETTPIARVITGENSRWAEPQQDLSFNSMISSTDMQFEKQLVEQGDVTNKIERVEQTNLQKRETQLSTVSMSPTRNIKRKLFFDGSKSSRKSYKLADIYEGMFGEKQPAAHRAEDDAVCLARCCLKYGQSIVDWFDRNNVPFNTIQPTYQKWQYKTC